MILVEDLPQSGIELASINTSDLFPFHATFIDDEISYIHNDGSLVVFFEIAQFNTVFIESLIKKISAKTTLQIYKLLDKNNRPDRYYGCIKVTLDYSSLKISIKKLISIIFKGPDDIVSSINDQTAHEFNKIKESISDNCNIISIKESGLYSYLIDCSINGSSVPHPAIVPKCNISVVMTGKTRCSSIVSINDISRATDDAKNIFNDFNSLLQIATIHKPVEEQNCSISQFITHIDSLVTATSDESEPLNETKSNKQYYFTNLSFILNSNSLLELDSNVSALTDKLIDYRIIPYKHSNSTNTHYVTCFPGNGNNASNFHIYEQKNVELNLGRFFKL